MKRRRYHPGRNFVALSTDLSPPRPSNENVQDNRLGLLFDSLIHTSPHSLDEHIYLHVRQLLHAASLTVTSVGEHYFRIFDRSLPIVSLTAFDEIASQFQDEAATPPTTCSILLLGMLLVSGPPSTTSHDRTIMYRTTKALMSQVQAHAGVSLRLVQANLFIAAAEHIAGRPEAAYVSALSCIAMQRVLGAQDQEMADVYCAMAVLER